MQREYGNRAATSLVLQRDRRGGPASTYARGYKKRPPQPVVEDLSPKTARFSGRSDESLKYMADKSSDVEEAWRSPPMYEELWRRNAGNLTLSRGLAMLAARAHAKVGNDKHAEFWRLVLSGKYMPPQQREKLGLPEDMSDKEF